MAIAREQMAILKSIFTEDLHEKDRDVKRTSFLMFLFAIGIFVASIYVFHLITAQIAWARYDIQEIPRWKFAIGYTAIFLVLTFLGRLLVPSLPMKLHGGGSYYLESESKLKGKGPISLILRGLLSFPNWLRMLTENFFESRRAVFDDRMTDLAIWFLNNLDMKMPVDDILWQKHGYSREERLYILGKLVSLEYVWLETRHEKVYAVHSYLTDDLFKKVERAYERKQDRLRKHERG